MKYLKIGEDYEKDGEKKTAWKTIGEMFESAKGKTYVKLYHIPGVLINVFEKEDRKPQAKESAPYEHGELKPDTDVPF